jgi:hypothetical protein
LASDLIKPKMKPPERKDWGFQIAEDMDFAGG